MNNLHIVTRGSDPRGLNPQRCFTPCAAPPRALGRRRYIPLGAAGHPYSEVAAMYLPTIDDLLTSRLVSIDLHQQWAREAARQRATGKPDRAAFCLGVCAKHRDDFSRAGRRIQLMRQETAAR